MSILDHFPYPSIRDVQYDLLRAIESGWAGHDVIVIVAPTATGKSAIAKTLLKWQYDAAYTVPTNLLLRQFTEEFPDTYAIHRMDSYQCTEFPGWSCAAKRAKHASKKFCRGCHCAVGMAKAMFTKSPVACNYYSLMARKIQRSTLICDEAHNLIPTVADLGKQRFWYHKEKGMPTGGSHPTIRKWLDNLPKHKRETKGRGILYHTVSSEHPQYVMKETEDEWTGGGLVGEDGEVVPRSVPIMAPCLDLLPIDIRDLPPTKWLLGAANRIVLMSATINAVDISDLGLDRRRVLYLECESPIPAERRPIYYEPISTVSHDNLEWATKQIADHIENHLLPQYEGAKGLVHTTYEQARILRTHLTSTRFMFHSRDPQEKARTYAAFRASPPEQGRVLVASGMEEGIDLADEAGRWQVIAKIPWISLDDPAVRHRSEADPNWYTWQTWRKVLQASGRICRGPEDWGDTHIVDGSFNRLLREAPHQIPRWWRVALDEGNRQLQGNSALDYGNSMLHSASELHLTAAEEETASV